MRRFVYKISELFDFLLFYPFHFIKWLAGFLFSRVFYFSPVKLSEWQNFRAQLHGIVRDWFDLNWRGDKPKSAIRFFVKSTMKRRKTDVLYVGTFKADAQKDIVSLKKYLPDLHVTAVVVKQIIGKSKFFLFQYCDDVVFIHNQAQLVNLLLSTDAKALIMQGGDNVIDLLNCCIWEGRLVWQVRDTALRIPMEYIGEFYYRRAKFIGERADKIVTFHHKEGWDLLRLDMKFRSEVLSMPPLCVPEIGPNRKVTKLSKKDGKIHIVYAGGIAPSTGIKVHHMHFFHASLHNKFKTIVDQKIHLHVYSIHLDYFTSQYSDFFELERSNPYFHIEKRIPFEDLLVAFTQYDWGLVHITWNQKYFLPGFEYPIQNGVMGPVQSGIPIIVSSAAKGNALVAETYKRGVVVDETDIPNLKHILKQNSHLIEFCEKTPLPRELLYDVDLFGKAVLPSSP